MTIVDDDKEAQFEQEPARGSEIPEHEGTTKVVSHIPGLVGKSLLGSANPRHGKLEHTGRQIFESLKAGDQVPFGD